MKLWEIEAQDTLTFGDGKSAGFGEPMQTLPMPLPSTIAGFVRTRLGTNAQGKFEWTHAQARAQEVFGPWLASLDMWSESIKEHYFPAPLDAVFFSQEGQSDKLRRLQLAPCSPQAGEQTNLSDEYQLVGFKKPQTSNPGKPARGPLMWSWSELKRWLEAPDEDALINPSSLGISALPKERRIHVSIDPEQLTAADGALFQTEQLRFIRKLETTKAPQWQRLSIIFGTRGEADPSRLVGASTIGGERRIAHVRSSQSDALTPPQLKGASLVRVVLLTPALFEQGWRPSAETLGPHAKLIAAKVGRPVPVSGWSFEHRGPKPTRYMAPAGSVYWIELTQDAQAWIDARQLTSISDDTQDQRDGFGLIAIGRG